MSVIVLMLTPEDIGILRKTVEKFLQWVEIAIENKVEMNKELPSSTITCAAMKKHGDEWYYQKGLELKFNAFSQNVENHQLVIRSNTIKAAINEFIDIKLEDMYLSKEYAQELMEGIKQESLDAKIIEMKQNQSNQELFN